MTIEDFIIEIDKLNGKSKFKLIFETSGGYIRFFNTSGKAFELGLNSIRQCFKDIKIHIVEFQKVIKYVEGDWRDVCSNRLTDDAANAISTVQSKPLFASLSKILSIATNTSDTYNDDYFNIDDENLDIVISFLDDLIDLYNQKLSNEIKSRLISKEDKSLRKIIFETFKLLLERYGEDTVLGGYEEKDSKIKGKSYKGICIRKYFGPDNLIGIFNANQNIDDLKSSNTLRFIDERITILGNEFSYFTTQWNNKDGRGLSLKNYNIFLSDISEGTFQIVLEDGVFKLVIDGTVEEEEPITFDNSNIIYYGAPGTGKSHRVDEIINQLDKEFYERVTFHPEFDNAAFVGSYKPKTVREKYKDEDGKEFFQNEIHYKFVPQAFTEIYKRAWKGYQNGEQYYLVIEEINRGNCAEIFGEIFQLLDRNANYTVSPSTELKEYLEAELGVDHLGIKDGLKLPPNLAIYATMNTSDQSLFPIDAAFKRRWDWEYIPICYEEKTEVDKANDSFNYLIEIDSEEGISSIEFRWIDFIKGMNKIIKNEPHLGMDKCIGNYFVKPQVKDSKIITSKQFVNKVIFYLWNDVFKDEETSIFTENDLTYESFFPLKTNGAKNAKLIIEECIKLAQEN